MHSFRLRYVALGLLIYIQSAFSDTCGSDGFVDVASSTVLSSAVFEGQPETSARLKDGRSLVWFRVTTIYKGNVTGVWNNDSLQVLVGHFGPSEDRYNCVAPIGGLQLNSRTSYLVFLNRTGRPVQSVSVDEFEGTNSTNYYSKINNVRSVFYYSISGFPENARKPACQEARDYSSPKSAAPPQIVLTVAKQPRKVGQRFQLTCKVTKGKPSPVVTWIKDGTALESSKHLVLRKKKGRNLNYVLNIRKVKAEDAGIYQCLAVNVVGSMRSENVTVELSEKQHVKPCSHQNYCLNEGTCYILIPLDKKLCECKPEYEGKRCQEKATPLARMPNNKRRLFKRMHGSHS